MLDKPAYSSYNKEESIKESTPRVSVILIIKIRRNSNRTFCPIFSDGVTDMISNHPEQFETDKAVHRLALARDLPDEALAALIEADGAGEALAAAADGVRRREYGDEVYIRGLIEFTNHCKNNCLYCGIRCGNTHVTRYRLEKEEILSCADEGYALGLRTFVLQGGEDVYFDADRLCGIVYALRSRYPDCAVTLSVGERSADDYRAFFRAGASRYLLRHETATDAHYAKLHPASMSLANRKKCLFTLKEIGYQTGSGFMVGSPYQTTPHLLADLRFLQELSPDMIGIGPFIRHAQTPFSGFPSGSADKTLRLVSILRLMFPHALIPATTALNTILPDGRERGLRSGANVVMPNLSPMRVRELYALYDNKRNGGSEAAEHLADLKKRVAAAGYQVVTAVGDVKRAVSGTSGKTVL